VAYYLTTPIYYVNAEPHLGHAYTTIAADILARHMRQRGEEVFFLTGTDEHGEPVAQAAERQGMTPQELVDRNAPKFKDLVQRVNATNDFFIRTSDPEHKKAVQEVLQAVHDRGWVYAGHYEGYYCPRCADFKTEAELLDGNKCPIHLIELEREVEDNWFFKLSAFQEPLEKLYVDNPQWVLPDFRYNEALSFIRQGLQDISLSRVRISWGVEVPWEPSQVFYVWFDALLNYYTALTYARPGEDLLGKFWPPTVQLLAKDILKFHAVIWPALLMAAELPLPKQLYIHGYLLMDDKKMSKSLGNVIDPFQVIDRYGTDALRFYLMREVSFGQDGSVSTEGFETRYTSELANEYGNLASRTLAMIERYRDGVVRRGETHIGTDYDGIAEKVCDQLDHVDVTAALDEIWRLVRGLNRYVTVEAPWQLAKDADAAERLDDVLYDLAEGLRVVSLLLHPYMPDATDALLSALGEERRGLDAARFGEWAGGSVHRIDPLFPRIEE
jgi:methionyl-tRNA synthetase